MNIFINYTPAPRRGRGVYCFTSVLPSKIFFVAFFSVTVDGRDLIFGHKRHIGTPYRGKRFWTHQIPTSCLPTLLIFLHIEHICSFLNTNLRGNHQTMKFSAPGKASITRDKNASNKISFFVNPWKLIPTKICESTG
jgi:hypothetical protein